MSRQTKRYHKQMLEFAKGHGLSVDSETPTVYGYVSGQYFNLYLEPSNRILKVVFHAKNAEDQPLSGAEMNSIQRSSKNILLYTDAYVINVRANASAAKHLENAWSAMNTVADYLNQNGYVSVCAHCKTKEPLDTYLIDQKPDTLCPECYHALANKLAATQQERKEKRSSMVTGLVGALIGSVAGVAVIVLLGQLGYVASLSGVVLAVCTLKGYELLGGKINWSGIVLCSLIMLVMTSVGFALDWGFLIHTQAGLDLVTSVRIIPYLLSEKAIDTAAFYGNLFGLYAFVLVGAVPTVKNIFKKEAGGVTLRRAVRASAT